MQVIGAARAGGLWLATRGGLWRWDGATWTAAGGPGPWSQGAMNALCEWDNGVIAIGTAETGLFLLHPGEPAQRLGRADRMGGNWIGASSVMNIPAD